MRACKQQESSRTTLELKDISRLKRCIWDPQRFLPVIKTLVRLPSVLSDNSLEQAALNMHFGQIEQLLNSGNLRKQKRQGLPDFPLPPLL